MTSPNNLLPRHRRYSFRCLSLVSVARQSQYWDFRNGASSLCHSIFFRQTSHECIVSPPLRTPLLRKRSAVRSLRACWYRPAGSVEALTKHVKTANERDANGTNFSCDEVLVVSQCNDGETKLNCDREISKPYFDRVLQVNFDGHTLNGVPPPITV